MHNMTKGSRSNGGRAGKSSRGGSTSGQSAANTRMWGKPASAKQISALKVNGNFDGKYYSGGRAGQTIGESKRAAGGDGK